MKTNLMGIAFCQVDSEQQMPQSVEQHFASRVVVFSWHEREKNLCIVHDEHVVLSHLPLISCTQIPAN